MLQFKRHLVTTPDGTTLAVDSANLASVNLESGEVVLLIAGGAQSMDWWDDHWCRSLVDAGLGVIRYDHRDTGESTTWPVGEPGYTSAELTCDPVTILDALDVKRAHLVGLSMGGGIAQKLAVDHPERLTTLTLMSTTPACPMAGDQPLPPPAQRIMGSFEQPEPEPNWSDTSAVVDYRVAIERPYAAAGSFDPARLRPIAEREVARTASMAASLTNHFTLDGGELPAGSLRSIAVPTLVTHGTDDPMFPIEHGKALAREIPNATLLSVDGMGHEIPPPSVRNTVLPLLFRHIGGGAES